ncbi:MAG: PA14 domain-containing protein [Armatimonadota bacterium]
MKGRGFTLIELLVVIAIIGILAAILFPVFAKAREKARQTTCVSNQKQIATALLMYAQDYDETFPDASSVWQAVDFGSPRILQCPTKGKRIGNAYVYHNMVAGMSLGDIADPSDMVLTADGAHAANKAGAGQEATYDNILYNVTDYAMRHNGGAVCSYVDGHIRWVNPVPIYYGINASYFNNGSCSGPPALRRIDTTIAYAWLNDTPDPVIRTDSFSARWEALLVPKVSSTYTIITGTDDDGRVWIDGQNIIDNWDANAGGGTSTPMSLTAGHYYHFSMEYRDAGGGAVCNLYWNSPATGYVVIPANVFVRYR